MPDEALINELETLFTEVINLGGQNERSQVVPNLTIQDANPTNQDGFVIISDDRDGDNILAKKVPSVAYADNDLVNVLFVRGGEAIAFQQGSQSPSGDLWEVVSGTSIDIFYDRGDVGIGKSAAPDATLEILDTAQAQLRLTHTEDTKFADFTLDTNHDLTIQPSSTGQIKIQPTTDSVDFFQVLDADGGTPVLNVDSVNERVGVGTASPSQVVEIRRDGSSFLGLQITNNDSLAGTSAGIQLTTAITANGGLINFGPNDASRPDTMLFFSGGALSNGLKFEADAGGIRMETSFVEAMRITAGQDVGIGTIAPSLKLHVIDEDAVTNAITNIAGIGHNSTGTPAANFGAGLLYQLESSTTENQSAARLSTIWATATHATRKARSIWSVYDTAEREGVRIEASGSAPMVGFYGVTAVVRPTALTSALTQISHTGPGTPDYAIATPIDSGAGSAWGFSTQDEFETVMSVVLNLQTRVDEMETKLQSLGLLT